MAIDIRNMENYSALRNVAEQMVIAARTAPKTKGKDVIHAAIIDGDDLKNIARVMKEISEETGHAFFERDANNVLNSQMLILLGCEIQTIGLNPCGMCGFDSCATKNENPNNPCVFNTLDLGIALGSAVSVAADNRVDNRIMYTIGQAALRLNIFGDNVHVVCGIPISAKGKNIFVDRK